jgi:hypothetical protein
MVSDWAAADGVIDGCRRTTIVREGDASVAIPIGGSDPLPDLDRQWPSGGQEMRAGLFLFFFRLDVEGMPKVSAQYRGEINIR